MLDTRIITKVIAAEPASDGAGVALHRSIATNALPDLDPFLLLDEFNSENPDDYIAGFPDHPHRGFETVTYMIDGRMRHKDSAGNEGVLTPGSIQWMTAGRGIVHSEMPEQEDGRMRGFQLWVNLPAKDKMVAPRYQEFAPEDLAVVTHDDGTEVRIVAGEHAGRTGPVTDIAVDPIYLDITLPAGATIRQPTPLGHTAFAYTFGGEGVQITGTPVPYRHLGLLSDGEAVAIRNVSETASRVLLIAGAPFNEPIARYGPFVMNTREEIMQAFDDFKSGRFA